MKIFIKGVIDFEAPHLTEEIKQLARDAQNKYVLPAIQANQVSESYASPGWQVGARYRSFTREAYTMETARAWVNARNTMMKENPLLSNHILTIEIIEAIDLESAILNQGTTIAKWDTYGNLILGQ